MDNEYTSPYKKTLVYVKTIVQKYEEKNYFNSLNLNNPYWKLTTKRVNLHIDMVMQTFNLLWFLTLTHIIFTAYISFLYLTGYIIQV